MRLVLFLAVLCGCLPTARSLDAQRSRVWAPPRATTVFSWVSTVEHRETRVIELGKEDASSRHEVDDAAVHTAIFAIDPETRRETRLGQLAGDGGVPVYYDAARDILWVRSEKQELVGFTRSGKPILGPQHQRQIEVAALEVPFVLARSSTGIVSLHDLRRETSVALPGDVETATISVTGDVVRFTAIAAAGEAMRVHQVAIDWSSGAPHRLPDIDWTTAPLASQSGVRLASGMLRDGLRYAEVVRGPDTTTRLLVFDILAGDPPVQLPLPVDYATESPSLANGKLVALGGDALAFVEIGAKGEAGCLRGATVRVDRKLVVPLPADRCVLEAGAVGPHGVLTLRDVGVAVVAPDATLAVLGNLDADTLAKSVATGPTTRALARGDGTLEEIDVSTGARRPLGHGDRGDRLIHVDATAARYTRGTDTLVTFPLGGNGTPSVLALGQATLARGDQMPIDRTELWLGGGGGVTTRGNGAGGINAEIAHWIRDHWTWVVRASFRGVSEADAENQSYIDAGAAFGFAWHRLPRLFSLFVEADIGANYSATYVEKTRTDAAFAPSAEIHLGWQGKMLGIDVAAVVPSFIDIDRGILFTVNAKIGFTENLR